MFVTHVRDLLSQNVTNVWTDKGNQRMCTNNGGKSAGKVTIAASKHD